MRQLNEESGRIATWREAFNYFAGMTFFAVIGFIIYFLIWTTLFFALADQIVDGLKGLDLSLIHISEPTRPY